MGRTAGIAKVLVVLLGPGSLGIQSLGRFRLGGLLLVGRAWATERKDLPDSDVARAGGWRDTRALTENYQQADPATMLRVVSHGA